MPKFKKGTPEAKAHMEQLRAARNYNKMKGHEDLIITRTAKIGVPKKMLYINPNGDQKIINTLTKRGNLTSRDHHPVINLVDQDSNHVGVINMGLSKRNLTKKLTHAKFIEKRDNYRNSSSSYNYSILSNEYDRLSAIINKKTKLTQKNIDEIKAIKYSILHKSPDTIEGLKRLYLYADEESSRRYYKEYLDRLRNIYDEVSKMSK